MYQISRRVAWLLPVCRKKSCGVTKAGRNWQSIEPIEHNGLPIEPIEYYPGIGHSIEIRLRLTIEPQLFNRVWLRFIGSIALNLFKLVQLTSSGYGSLKKLPYLDVDYRATTKVGPPKWTPKMDHQMDPKLNPLKNEITAVVIVCEVQSVLSCWPIRPQRRQRWRGRNSDEPPDKASKTVPLL